MSIYKYALDFWQAADYGPDSALLYLCHSLWSACMLGGMKKAKIGLIYERRNALYSLKNYQRKWEQDFKGPETEVLNMFWPCLGRQLSVFFFFFFSALLLIHLISLCLLQTALHHLLCSALVKNDSVSHLWKCLPGRALLLPYFSTKPAMQPCSAEWESSISAKTLSLSAVKE